MNSIEQMKLALGEPLKRSLGGLDFEFYPLEITSMPDYIELSFKLASAKDDKEYEEILFQKENMEKLIDLIIKFSKQNFPKDVPEDILHKFITKYFSDLQAIFMELHSQNVDKLDANQKKRLEQLKSKFQHDKP